MNFTHIRTLNMKLKFTIFCFLFVFAVNAQVTMTTTGSYSQDFNTLSSTPAATPAWADNTTIASWYSQRTGAGAGTYVVGTGSSNAGALYSFGSASASDRALGTIGSGTPDDMAHGLLLRNTSGNTITNMTVAYTGEQWRDAKTSPVDVLTVWYKVSGSAITSLDAGNPAGWTAVTALNFSSPQNTSSSGIAINGNATANRTVFSAVTLPSLSLADNSYIMIKWDDPDNTGSDHGMAIDDVTVNWTVTPVGPCSDPVNQSSALATANVNTTGLDLSWANAASASGSVIVIRPTATAAAVPVDGTVYLPTTVWTTAAQINTNNRVFYTGSGTTVTGITGLTPGTQYTATVYSYNTASCYNTISPVSVDFYTLSTEPTTHPGAGTLVCSQTGASSLQLAFPAANTLGSAVGYVILMSTVATPTGVPADGTIYAAGATLGNGVVAGYTSVSGTDTTYAILGLDNGTTYYFSIIPFNSYLSVAATINYRTAATIRSTSCNTPNNPEITVRGIVGSNPTIPDGDTTPQGTNNTLFGTITVGQPGQAKQFRITNSGNAILNVSSITMVGGDNTNFVVSGITLPRTVAVGASVDFTVTFNPSAPAGTKQTTLTIANDDPNENPYDFVIRGTADVISSIEINVKGNGSSIPDNSIYPMGTNHTAFGVATVGVTTVVRTFTIESLGSGTLTLTGTPRVKISGANASMFTVTAQPSAATIAGGASLTFQITFNPTAPGSKVATVIIDNDDSNENPYNFNISGNADGVNNIYVYGNNNDVINGSTTTLSSNLTNFGGVAITTGLKQNTFVIGNFAGVATRYFSNIVISGADAAMFSVAANPSSASGGGFTSFTINFTPTSIGTKNATVTFRSYEDQALTDPDNIDPVYTFAISGIGENFNACGFASVQTIALQNFEDTPASPNWDYTYATDATIAITGGQLNNGSTLKDAFLDAKSFQMKGVGSGTPYEKTVISLAAVNTASYSNVNMSLRVAAFRITNSQGLDVNDVVYVETSIDGGANWSSEAVLAGNNNSRWDFATTGQFTTYYAGLNAGTRYSVTPGGIEYTGTAGISTINIRNLPSVSSLLVRISIEIDRDDEMYAIDNIKIEGQIASASIWNGGPTWVGGTPTSTTKAIINADYNTAINGSISACECQINSGATLTVDRGTVPYKYFEIEGKINNNGTLIRNSGGSIIQKDSGAINTGDATIYRTTSSYEKYDYVYWASPVADETMGSVFGSWRTDYAFSFDATQFEDLITYETGVAPADGFDDSAPWAWTNTGTLGKMDEGVGYIVMTPTAGSFPTTATVDFTGPIHNGTITVPLKISPTSGDYNLIGNPYASEIDANLFIPANLGSTTGTLYFWTHKWDISASNPGPGMYDFSSDDYALLTLVGGTATGNPSNSLSIPPNRYIPSEQGFFVEATAGTSVIFTNAMRARNFTSVFYRNAQEQEDANDEMDKIWINLQNDSGLFCQQLIAYSSKATLGVDPGYDGSAIKSNNALNFYSLIDDEQYRIQARPAFEDSDKVQLGYTSKYVGTLTMSIDKTEKRLNDGNTPVYIEDKMLNIIHNLKESPYSFATERGSFDDRFVLRYTDNNLGTGSFQTVNTVTVISNAGEIKVKASAKMNSLKVYDILGRELFNENTVDSKEYSIKGLNVNQQALVIKIQMENGQTVTRKIVF